LISLRYGTAQHYDSSSQPARAAVNAVSELADGLAVLALGGKFEIETAVPLFLSETFWLAASWLYNYIQ